MRWVWLALLPLTACGLVSGLDNLEVGGDASTATDGAMMTGGDASFDGTMGQDGSDHDVVVSDGAEEGSPPTCPGGGAVCAGAMGGCCAAGQMCVAGDHCCAGSGGTCNGDTPCCAGTSCTAGRTCVTSCGGVGENCSSSMDTCCFGKAYCGSGGTCAACKALSAGCMSSKECCSGACQMGFCASP